jgi:hypothetical protein
MRAGGVVRPLSITLEGHPSDIRAKLCLYGGLILFFTSALTASL